MTWDLRWRVRPRDWTNDETKAVATPNVMGPAESGIVSIPTKTTGSLSELDHLAEILQQT